MWVGWLRAVIGGGTAAGAAAGAASTASGADGSVALAAIAVAATLAGAIVLLVKIFNESRAANAAVNNVGPGEHSLYDAVQHLSADVTYLVQQQRDFAEKGWLTLPADLSTAAALTEVVRDLQHGQTQLDAQCQAMTHQIKTIHDFLRDHDEWERQQKYGTD